jgi:PAS domain-containing protein
VSDWTALAHKLGKIGLSLRADGCELQAEAFLGESLRILLESPGSGFVPWDEHMRVLEMNRTADRANGERAQELLRHERAEYARKLADARQLMAEAIRANVNERVIPSAYRRQGALMVAGWLDGGVR